jgi:hypothetical protein
MSIMATRTKSFPIPPAMLTAIKRWADLAGTSDSEVIRVAVELGLRSLKSDPSPLLGHDLGPPETLLGSSEETPSKLEATPVMDEDPSRAPAARAKAEREGIKMPPVKPVKRPQGPRDRGSSGRTGSKGSEG